MILFGHDIGEIGRLLEAFKAKGIDNINEMICLIDDPSSSALDYKAQALAAEAKLNRIKTFLKD